MMKRMSLLVILFSILCAPAAFAVDRLRVAYSSISAAYTGIWVAHDAGFFAKEGLENQIIFIGSATQLAQVLVAGDVDIASLGGGPVMAASLSGADLKSSATTSTSSSSRSTPNPRSRASKTFAANASRSAASVRARTSPRARR